MEFNRRRWLKMTAAACASGWTQFTGLGRAAAADCAAPAAASGALARLSLNENPFGPAPGAKAAIARTPNSRRRWPRPASRCRPGICTLRPLGADLDRAARRQCACARCRSPDPAP